MQHTRQLASLGVLLTYFWAPYVSNGEGKQSGKVTKPAFEQMRTAVASGSGEQTKTIKEPTPEDATKVVDILPSAYTRAVKNYIDTVDQINRDPRKTQKYSRSPLDIATTVLLQEHLLGASLEQNGTPETYPFAGEPEHYLQEIRQSGLNHDEQMVARLIPTIKLFRLGLISREEAEMISTLAAEYTTKSISSPELAASFYEQGQAILRKFLLQGQFKSLTITKDQTSNSAGDVTTDSKLEGQYHSKQSVLCDALGIALGYAQCLEQLKLHFKMENYKSRIQAARSSMEAERQKSQKPAAPKQESKTKDVRYILNGDGTLTEIKPTGP